MPAHKIIGPLHNVCFQILDDLNHPVGSGFFIDRHANALTAHHVLKFQAANLAFNISIRYRGKRAPYRRAMRNVPARSYPATEGDVAYLSVDPVVTMPAVDWIRLNRSRRTNWLDGRELQVFGFSHVGHTTLTGTADPGALSKTPGGQQLIRLNLSQIGGIRISENSQIVKSLKGLSGAPVYDRKSNSVIAIVQSFEPKQVSNNRWIVYAAAISDFDRIIKRIQPAYYLALRAAALVLILLLGIFGLWTWLNQPDLDLHSFKIEYELGTLGGDITLVGESKKVAGTRREILFFVNPENKNAEGWYLQRESKGLDTLAESGEWRGTVQLGSEDYPPDGNGQPYSLAIVIVSRYRAERLHDKASKNSDYKVKFLPDTNFINCWVQTWRDLEFQTTDPGD